MSGDDNELVFATLSQLRCFYALGCALYSSTNFE